MCNKVEKVKFGDTEYPVCYNKNPDNEIRCRTRQVVLDENGIVRYVCGLAIP